MHHRATRIDRPSGALLELGSDVVRDARWRRANDSVRAPADAQGRVGPDRDLTEEAQGDGRLLIDGDEAGIRDEGRRGVVPAVEAHRAFAGVPFADARALLRRRGNGGEDLLDVVRRVVDELRVSLGQGSVRHRAPGPDANSVEGAVEDFEANVRRRRRRLLEPGYLVAGDGVAVPVVPPREDDLRATGEHLPRGDAVPLGGQARRRDVLERQVAPVTNPGGACREHAVSLAPKQTATDATMPSFHRFMGSTSACGHRKRHANRGGFAYEAAFDDPSPRVDRGRSRRLIRFAGPSPFRCRAGMQAARTDTAGGARRESSEPSSAGRHPASAHVEGRPGRRPLR
jgi:hypothetical protein